MEDPMTDAPLTLALVFGGRSGEHDVSVVSADEYPPPEGKQVAPSWIKFMVPSVFTKVS